MADNFSVKRVGTQAVIVDHPAVTPKFYEVGKDKFWKKGKEEQRTQVIGMYLDSIDIENSDIDVVAMLYQDDPRNND